MGCIPSEPVAFPDENNNQEESVKQDADLDENIHEVRIGLYSESQTVSMGERPIRSESNVGLEPSFHYSHEQKQLIKESTVKCCSYCRRSQLKIRVCERCRGAYYCSHKCITADWPNHEKKCVYSPDNKAKLTALKPAQEKLLKVLDDVKGLDASQNKRILGLSAIKNGEAYFELSLFSKSLSCYENALEIGKEIKDMEIEAVASSGIGRINIFFGKFSKALDFHIQQLEKALQIRNPNVEMISLVDLGMVYRGMGQFVKAIECGKRALALEGDTHSKIIANNGLGTFYVSLGEYEKAKDYFQVALNLSLESKDKMEEGRAYRGLGNVERSMLHNSEALEYMNNALEIALFLGDRAGECAIYNNMGNAYKSLGKQFKAMLYYQQAINIASELKDRSAEAAAHNNFASLYLRLNDTKEAIDAANRAIEIAGSINDYSHLAESYFNLACARRSLNHIEEARESFSKVVEILSEHNCNPKLLKKAHHQIERLDENVPRSSDHKESEIESSGQ